MNVLEQLADANRRRQKEWDPEGKTHTLLYRSNELVGEIGEALEEAVDLIALAVAGGRAANLVKKLERERLGVRGSRATKEQLAQELADIIICCSLVGIKEDIELWPAVVAKFNKTSDAVGLSIKLTL